MSYDTLRSTVRDAIDRFQRDETIRGRILVDDHPPGAEDMMTLSIFRDGVIVHAFLFVARPNGRTVRVDEIDLRTLERRILGAYGLLRVDDTTHAPGVRSLCSYLNRRLSGKAQKIGDRHLRETRDLGERALALRPRARPKIGPTKEGSFNLYLHGLSREEVLRAVEALPEVLQTVRSRTMLDHLLEDGL